MPTVITDKEKLNAGMAATADAIRDKTGGSAAIAWDYQGETGFASAIRAIPSGGEAVLVPLTVTENRIYTPPEGVDGYSMVIAGVTVRSPRCDHVTTFDWGAQQQYMAWMDGTPEPKPEPEPGPEPTPEPPTPGGSSWTNGTDAEVAALLDAAAAGTIDLQEDAGWRVGDKRLIHIDAWTGGSDVAHAAEDLLIVISSFSEYTGCGNILQFDFAECCTESQAINDTLTTVGGYGASEMKTVTLPALAEALPSWLKTRLKTFSVLASAGYPNISTIETVKGNKLALRSSVEVFGAEGMQGEGAQLAYYTARENRIKRYATEIPGYYAFWGTRTPRGDIYYYEVTNEGYLLYANANFPHDIAPFGCLGGLTELPGPSVSFTSGTDAEVAAAIDAAQAGTIDLQKGVNAWHVGDMRTIHVDSFVGIASDDEGAHDGIVTDAQDVRIVISSFEEYMDCGNVMQFDFVDCITVGLPMEGTDSTADGYYRTAMWNTLRMSLHYALPSWLYSRLKPFSVYVSKGGANIGIIETVYNNYLALRSAVEIFGNSQQADQGEGSQIAYYTTAANRIKTLGIGGSAADWWERSPWNSTDFSYVSSSGTNSGAAASARKAAAPFGCL